MPTVSIDSCIDDVAAAVAWAFHNGSSFGADTSRIIVAGHSAGGYLTSMFGRYEENAYMWRMMKLIGHPDVEIYELQGFNHGDMASPAFHILKNCIKRILMQ